MIVNSRTKIKWNIEIHPNCTYFSNIAQIECQLEFILVILNTTVYCIQRFVDIFDVQEKNWYLLFSWFHCWNIVSFNCIINFRKSYLCFNCSMYVYKVILLSVCSKMLIFSMIIMNYEWCWLIMILWSLIDI